MYSIRRNVFETNSSSSHSLVIRSDALLNELEEDIYFTHEEMLESLDLDKKGEFSRYEDDWNFGRFPFQPIDTFAMRFKYAYANFCYDEDVLAELISLLYELVPECKSIWKPKYAGTDDAPLFGWMKKYNFDLREFLTNKKYIVIQDGDEYNIWVDMVHAGLIDTGALDNRAEVEKDA